MENPPKDEETTVEAVETNENSVSFKKTSIFNEISR